MSNEALIAETRERSTFAEYEATEDAQWWAARARVLADALEAAERKPVIDREALARQMFIADNWGVADSARLWDELLAHPVEFERYRKRADAVIASGLIEDKREAQAEALERYADNRWGKRGPDRVGMNGMFDEELRIRARAAEIREGRA